MLLLIYLFFRQLFLEYIYIYILYVVFCNWLIGLVVHPLYTLSK